MFAAESERRKLASVLFCDMSGSTAMGERVDAESSQIYLLATGDVGRQVRCRVTAHNAGGDSAPVDSNALDVTAPLTPQPTGDCSLCILGPASSVNLTSSGRGTVTAPGGSILINGKTRISGSGRIRAEAIGMFPRAASGSHFSPQPVALSRTVADPLASLSLAAPSARCERVRAGNRAITLHPGTYCGLSLSGKGRVTLSAGLYVFTGDVHLSGRSSLRGTGVNLRLAGASVELSGGSTMNITAPGSGRLRSVALAFERHSRKTLTLIGESRATLDGALYGKAAELRLSGSAIVTCDDAPIVIGQVTKSGSSKVIARAGV